MFVGQTKRREGLIPFPRVGKRSEDKLEDVSTAWLVRGWGEISDALVSIWKISTSFRYCKVGDVSFEHLHDFTY